MILLLALAAQSAPGIDDMAVDKAVRAGVEFLRKAPSPDVGFARIDDSDELILLTLVHAGVPATDPKAKALLDRILARDIERTYEAALGAMVLEEIDRVKYQGRIAQCAQHLVDNQCENGQWSYGEPTAFAKDVPPSKDVASGGGKKDGVLDFGGGGPSEKPKVVRKIPVRKMKAGPAAGDNSNSQYAALGLRACHDAGILLPKDVLEKARRWWIASQHPETGKDRGAVASGEGGGVRGWCYNRTDVCAKTHQPYGSMTAGAAGALVILDHMLGLDWKRDPALRAGLNWLSVHWSVSENPGPTELRTEPKTELFYYLYAVERLGMLSGLDKIGGRLWYSDGAKAILAAQRKDGSWDDGVDRSTPTWDTCFAILFLKKATRPMVASGEGR